MTVYCPKCNKGFKNNAGLGGHTRSSKTCGLLYNSSTNAKPSPKKHSNSIRTSESTTSKIEDPLPQQDQVTTNVLTEPSLEDFSSNWLNDYEEKESEQKQDQEAVQEQQSLNNPFTLTQEQYVQFYLMLNDFLDTLITMAGGDETFSLMKKNTVNNLASQTKSYADSLNFQLSPQKMLLVSITLAYSVPTTKALRSIRANRKSLKLTNMKQKELEEMQKNVTIENLGDNKDE